MRIARALALAGVDSRRNCEQHILEGRVQVNGKAVFDLGRQVDPEKDTIKFRKKLLHFQLPIYYMLNKPRGYTTTASTLYDPKIVYSLLPPNLVKGVAAGQKSKTRVFPVGRLDRDSTGLLLFTNDGALSNKLTHPRFGVEKWYEVKLDKALELSDKAKLLKGVYLEDGKAKFYQVKKINQRLVKLMLREGKKREIRRVFEKLGYRVLQLERNTFGPLKLGVLPRGKGRYLTPSEIDKLKKTSP